LKSMSVARADPERNSTRVVPSSVCLAAMVGPCQHFPTPPTLNFSSTQHRDSHRFQHPATPSGVHASEIVFFIRHYCSVSLPLFLPTRKLPSVICHLDCLLQPASTRMTSALRLRLGLRTLDYPSEIAMHLPRREYNQNCISGG